MKMPETACEFLDRLQAELKVKLTEEQEQEIGMALAVYTQNIWLWAMAGEEKSVEDRIFMKMDRHNGVLG